MLCYDACLTNKGAISVTMVVTCFVEALKVAHYTDRFSTQANKAILILWMMGILAMITTKCQIPIYIDDGYCMWSASLHVLRNFCRMLY